MTNEEIRKLIEENARAGVYIDLLSEALKQNKLDVFDFIVKQKEGKK